MSQQVSINACICPVVHTIDEGRHNFIAIHAGLHRADRIALGDSYNHAFLAQRLRRPFTHVSVAEDQSTLSREQVVQTALDRVIQTVAATVLVVIFRLCDRVVDVDCRYLE